MTKTILSLVGLLAVGVVAYTFATGKKPDFVVEAEKNAVKAPAAQQTPAVQQAPAPQTPAPEPAPAPAEKKNDPNDPLTWDMTMIRKDPIRYFTTAVADSKEKHESIKAREGTMRVKQLELQRKVDENQAKADGLGVSDSVVFAGVVPDVYNYLNALDLFVFHFPALKII